MVLRFFNKRNKEGDRTEMSFIDHLEDLRRHLLRSIVAIVVGSIVVGVYNNFFIKTVMMGPVHPDFFTYKFLCTISHKYNLGEALCMTEIPIKMQNTSVGGQMQLFLSVILIGGVIVAFPYIFWQFWKFVSPALTEKEKKGTRGVIFWVSLLFFLGILFGYFLIAPYSVNFFANFSVDDSIENRWTITSYLDTLVPLILGTGITFQLPLVIYFLSKAGVVSVAWLRKYRRYAIVAILVFAAFITPPDVVSQSIVAAPVLLLYEISIVLAKRVEKAKAKEEAEEWS